MIHRTDVDPHWNLTDAEAVLRALNLRGRQGLHSHECAHGSFSHNASQRAKDLVSAGHALSKRRENKGRRQGVRLWLTEFAPADAVPVQPNYGSELGGDADDTHQGRGAIPSLTGAASPRGASGPVAVDPSAEEMAVVWDYTGAEPRYSLISVSELGKPMAQAAQGQESVDPVAEAA